ncbi:MAG TPA: hypothetical protein VKG82_07535 [Solirubrobacteraceae bacterium]|nr:hypothetical protein [Solirubrobacteraceae bacterium]
MSDEKQRREGELRVVASATGEPEADLICQRLAAVGITAIAQRSIGGPGFGPSGARDIYVLEDEVERARETLGT